MRAGDLVPLNEKTLILLGSGICIFGLRSLFIDRYGSNVPFWDQWDAEAYYLYAPYLEDRYSFLELFATHNEHRIVFTKVLGLIALELFDGWFPRFQMVLNSLLLSSFAVVLLETLARIISREAFIVVSATAIVFLGLPFAWENVFGGFQSQFYFLLLFSIVSFRTLLMTPSWSPLWLVGGVCAIGAYLSMAGGMFVPLACAICLILQLGRGVRPASFHEISGAIAVLSLAAISYTMIPHIQVHETLRAQSVPQFISALGALSAWPQHAAFSVLLNLPVVVFVLFVLLRRPAIRRDEWTVVGMALFVLGLITATAYGRAVDPTTSRYLEITAINVLINLAAVGYLVSHIRLVSKIRIEMTRPIAAALSSRRWLRWVPLAWAAAMVTAAVHVGMTETYPSVRQKAEQSRVQAENIRLYVTTGDAAHLDNKAHLEIPYPEPAHLAKVAGLPSIQAILPPEFGGERRNDGPAVLPKWVATVSHWTVGVMLGNGPIIVLIGCGVFLAGVYRTWGRLRHR